MSTYRVAGPPPVLVAAFGGRMYGIDPPTGRILWERELDIAGNPATLLLTPDTIFAASYSNLVCLRYPTGDVLWTTAKRTVGRSTMLLEGGLIFVGTAGEMECFSLTGQSLWHEKFKGKGVGEVALGVPGNVAQADERN
jgi:outer membrane protein assembly factor BamB